MYRRKYKCFGASLRLLLPYFCVAPQFFPRGHLQLCLLAAHQRPHVVRGHVPILLVLPCLPLQLSALLLVFEAGLVRLSGVRVGKLDVADSAEEGGAVRCPHRGWAGGFRNILQSREVSHRGFKVANAVLNRCFCMCLYLFKPVELKRLQRCSNVDQHSEEGLKEKEERHVRSREDRVEQKVTV